jgi:hypothetical protein
MIIWLISQHNDVTGETNISFVTEPNVNVEDHAIQSGSWKKAQIKAVAVQIETVDPTESLDELFNNTYHSDGFVDAEAGWETVSDDTIASALRQLKEVYK